MIVINNRFSMERDARCWHLRDHYVGHGKNGMAKLQKRTTYHANLAQIAYTVLDRTAGECESLADIHELLNNAQNVVTRRLNELVDEDLE